MKFEPRFWHDYWRGNWSNFTIVKLSFEWGGKRSYRGRYVEAELGLLGLNVLLDWYDEPSRDAAFAPIVDRIREYDERQP